MVPTRKRCQTTNAGTICPTTRRRYNQAVRPVGILELLTAIGILVVVAIGVAVRNSLSEAISNFRGGGPRPPSHPLPADDSRLLNRRGKRRSQDRRAL
jgi:hypothetical protein